MPNLSHRQRQLYQGRAIIVLLALNVAATLYAGNSTGLDGQGIGEIGAAAAVVVYALRMITPGKQQQQEQED